MTAITTVISFDQLHTSPSSYKACHESCHELFQKHKHVELEVRQIFSEETIVLAVPNSSWHTLFADPILANRY